MLDKIDIENFNKKITEAQARIGIERDKIDELISEMEMLKENCEEAFDNLQRTRDALSELV
jgi:chromosome segregation ATPase